MIILRKLRPKKISKIRGEDPFEKNSEIITSEENLEDVWDELVELEYIYCWKCVKSIPVNSKFYLSCGYDIKNLVVKEDDIEETSDNIPDEPIEKNLVMETKKYFHTDWCFSCHWWSSCYK